MNVPNLSGPLDTKKFNVFWHSEKVFVEDKLPNSNYPNSSPLLTEPWFGMTMNPDWSKFLVAIQFPFAWYFPRFPWTRGSYMTQFWTTKCQWTSLSIHFCLAPYQPSCVQMRKDRKITDANSESWHHQNQVQLHGPSHTEQTYTWFSTVLSLS